MLDRTDAVPPDFFAFLFGFDHALPERLNFRAQHHKQEHMVFYFLFKRVLIGKSQSCFLELFREVFIKLVHAFELCLEICVFGGDLLSNQ